MFNKFYIITAWILAIVLAVSVGVLSALYVGVHWKEEMGALTVNTMYTFGSPAELLEKQKLLEHILNEESYGKLNLDADFRAISAYFKFRYSSSAVHIVDVRNGYVLYWLENENISNKTRWLLFYTIEENGVKVLHEYQLIECGNEDRDSKW